MAEDQLIPGQPLRNGVDLIADKKTGALIVIGTSAKLEKISSGGVSLINCSYTPEMMSELAKMDGAIIVDKSVNNTHCYSVLDVNAQTLKLICNQSSCGEQAS